jgi:hypothetical protein
VDSDDPTDIEVERVESIRRRERQWEDTLRSREERGSIKSSERNPYTYG